MVTVATRLPLGLAGRGGWGDTTLKLPGTAGGIGSTTSSPGAPSRPVPSALAGLLSRYPVALLVRGDQ